MVRSVGVRACVCSDQQRGDAGPSRRVDGRRAALDDDPGRRRLVAGAVGLRGARRRRGVRARLPAGRGGDGVLRGGRGGAVP